MTYRVETDVYIEPGIDLDEAVSEAQYHVWDSDSSDSAARVVDETTGKIVHDFRYEPRFIYDVANPPQWVVDLKAARAELQTGMALLDWRRSQSARIEIARILLKQADAIFNPLSWLAID